MLNSYGQLEIRATKANGALPVKDAIVRIKGAEEENRFIVYSVLTDIEEIQHPFPFQPQAHLYQKMQAVKI